jgi:carboxyl-terminal processing protease
MGGAWYAQGANATTEAQSPYSVLQQLARVLVLVENEYVEPVDRARLTEGAIKGMVAELDPHSSYLPPRAFNTFRGDTEGEFGGVGIEVDFRGDDVTVIATIDGSPAQQAGIRPGDRIVAIDRVSVRGKSANDLVERMRGPPGTSVRVGIRRPDKDKIINFTLERQIISVASIYSEALVDGVAYLRIKQFQKGTHTELLESIGELKAGSESAIRGVILDVRNNPGGLVREAIAVADEFLDGGNIYSTRRRGETIDSVDASSGGALTTQPMVVLVNEYSASAAELVAGALQDQGRASVVGANTFGKGSVQSIIDLPDNAGLRLTTMRYYTPNGHAIQARGIRPDVMVEAAYVPDESFGVVRESDLENHLPAEGPAPNTPDETSTKPDQKIEEETGISPTHLGVARKVAKDPTGGPDFALSIGFQILRGVLQQN